MALFSGWKGATFKKRLIIHMKVCRMHVCSQVFQCTLMKCGPGVSKTISLNIGMVVWISGPSCVTDVGLEVL